MIRFRDPDLEDRFARDGYVTVSLFEADEADALAARFTTLQSGRAMAGNVPDGSFYSTVFERDAAFRTALDAIVRAEVAPRLPAILDGADMLAASFHTKVPGAPEVVLHQHPPFIAAPFERSLWCWCALAGCDGDGGTLMVVPGSHHLTRYLRTIDGGDFFADYRQALADEFAVPVPLRKGEAILFENSLIHGSTPNRTASSRPVVNVLMVPQGASQVLYRAAGDQVEVIGGGVEAVVGDKLIEQGMDGVAGPVLRSLPAWSRRATLPEVRSLLAAGARATEDFDPLDALGPRAGMSFRDPALQARLEADGYVVIPLLDKEAVERLTRDIPTLCPPDLDANIFDQWSYLSHFDRERRQAISNHVKAALDPAIDELMTGTQLHVGSVLQRGENAQALKPHQHPPAIADFSDGLVCWCPLVDCDARSGALQVVPRSHGLLRHVLRPGTPYAWHGLADEIDDYLVTLPVRAGEAVFFYESLIHGSAPNLRQRTRVALVAHLIAEDAVPAFFADSEDRPGEVDIYRSPDEFAQADLPAGWLPPRETWDRIGSMPGDWISLNKRQFDALLAGDARLSHGVDPYALVQHLADPPPAVEAPPAPAPRSHGPLYRFLARHTPAPVKATIRRFV